ncbi:MAG: ABC transporter substrate-binding protein [Firmicutes bacterium HGW-Firmicutes-13]|nr:MAG: ABC transporter substrate-binding protein [Firmicutes bacterium HGW-Firmicutes-13]
MKKCFKYPICLWILFLFLTVVFYGCSNPANNSVDKLMVAVSIVPQETFIKAVGGDLVEAAAMIPPGYSPENYSPTPQELEKFSSAALYFTIGLPSEEANILPKARDINKDIKIISLADEAAKVYPERELAPGKRDPHIWLSPKRVKIMVEVMARELAAVDYKNKEVYEKNAQDYIEKLDELDRQLKESFSSLENRTFIIYHPAFGYFSDDYGLNMLALEKDGKEATARELQEIIDTAKKENIKVIFYQEEVDGKQSRALAEEIGGKTEQLAPLAPDYIENLEKMAGLLTSVLE